MTLQSAPSQFTASEPLPDDAFACVGGTDWERAMLVRQVWIAAQLVEDSFAVSRAVAQRIVDPAPATEPARPAPPVEDEPAFQGDLGLAHHRAQGAVRSAMALQTTMIDALRDHDSDAKVDADIDTFFARREAKASKNAHLVDSRMARAQIIIEGVAEDEHDDAETIDGLIDAASLRMQADAFGPILAGPTSEVVACLCRELGLTPDWPRLARQAWARAEVLSGKVGAPLTPFSSPASGGGGSRRSRETEGAQPPEPESKPQTSPEPEYSAEPERPFRLDASRRSSFPASGEGEVAAPPPPPPDPTLGLPGELPPRRRPPPPPRKGEFIIPHMTRP